MLKLRLAFATMWLCGLISAVGMATPVSAGVEFPGPLPGVAKAEAAGGRLLLENKVLAVRWDLTDGLRLVEAKDKLTGEVWATGRSECVQIVFYESPAPKPRILKGSEMEVLGQPIVRDAAVTHASGRRSDQYAGKELVVRLAARDRSVTVEWRASLRDEANYVRQSVALQAGRDWVELDEIILLDVPAKEAKVYGSVDGSPAVAGRWFLGVEHPMSKSEVVADSGEAGAAPRRVRCSYPFAPPLKPGESQEYNAVLGLVPKDQLRRGFLYYLERERAHPYRPFLLHSIGEDIGYMYVERKGKPDEARKFSLGQNKWWLGIIEDFGRELVAERGVVIDCFAHDYLWDDTTRPWLFHQERYPDGFSEARRLAEKYGACLGIWYSPDAATGTSGRVPAGLSRRFEGYWVGAKPDQSKMGLSLAGPRYFARFRASCVNMLRRYNVSYFKFDGIADGGNAKYDYKPSGAGWWRSDFEALLRIYSELRTLNPNVFINSSTGAWPSPFLLLWADSIWHQGADVGTYGPEFKGWSKGSPRQRWITYRDSATFHNGLERGPLYPLNSYMVHGLVFNLCSLGGVYERVRGLDTKDIIDEIYSYFGSGTDLQEMYTHPSIMKPKTWDALAEAAKWSRANADVLVDTHWVGGDPAKDEVYGWASWTPRKGILTLRNPDDQAHSMSLDIATVFELPEGAPQNYRLKSPWRDDAQSGAIEVTAGRRHDFQLKPFEVLVFDATPF